MLLCEVCATSSEVVLHSFELSPQRALHQPPLPSTHSVASSETSPGPFGVKPTEPCVWKKLSSKLGFWKRASESVNRNWFFILGGSFSRPATIKTMIFLTSFRCLSLIPEQSSFTRHFAKIRWKKKTTYDNLFAAQNPFSLLTFQTEVTSVAGSIPRSCVGLRVVLGLCGFSPGTPTSPESAKTSTLGKLEAWSGCSCECSCGCRFFHVAEQ